MSAFTGSIRRAHRFGVLATIIFVVTASPASAQQHDHAQHGAAPADHSQHQAAKRAKPDEKKAPSKKPKGHEGHGARTIPLHDAHDAVPAEHSGHEQHGGMKGFLGPYAMTREGSGTSWVPDVTPHEGIHGRFGEWTTMAHAQFNFVLDRQGGLRGGDMGFVSGMVMAMAQRPLGDGTFGLRAMLSPDPFMGPSGYPLLLASGETADGKTHLIDRQHPHDLFMELAAIYSHNLSANSSFFLYAGLPGEPALGPPAFMHRLGGMDFPEAPITHHWLDSTHIAFGVATAGVVVDNWKLEASAFRGREPDQFRYDIEAPKLDSFSARVSWNPVGELSIQVSAGRLHSPEALDPMVNEDRITASATYAQPFGTNNIWSTTFAWGRKILRPGETLDGYLLESALILQKTYTVFMRAERVAETELHDDVPALAGRVLNVNKVSVGGIYDFYRTDHVKVGVGGLVSKYLLPDELKPLYSNDPTSAMVFMRLKVI